MPAANELLRLCKLVALDAGCRLLDGLTRTHKQYEHSVHHPREIKALADTVLERDILEKLAPTGLPILSEESGSVAGRAESSYRFIVDPLDGTFNFVKGLGPCAVSIALWQERTPIFGVIYSLTDRQLLWGGRDLGSFCDEQPIAVSAIARRSEASICTGLPVRFDMENATAVDELWRMVRPFAKVRMMGSAAMSLVSVARGSADAYWEQSIMLWDVAAGLAIVEGAGGAVKCIPGHIEHSLDAYAGNRALLEQMTSGS